VTVRGVYTRAEEEMLTATNAMLDTLVGWDESRGRLVATEESMLTMARAADPLNPLWQNAEYARRTRWGDVIAHPLFFDRLSGGGIGDMPASPECGVQSLIFIGEDWNFFHPIHKGDVFRVWRRRPQVVDVTPDGGTSPRTFGLVEADKDYVNQEDKVAAQVKNYVQRTFLPEPPKPIGLPEYAYTWEELRHMGEILKQEQVRGAEPRYWEDVEVGDRPTPTALGPTSMVDNLMSYMATPDFLMAMTTREWFLMALEQNITDEFIKDEATGLFHVRNGPAGWHWSNHAAQAAGEPHAFLFAKLSRLLMCRCLTNWMGDDGYLTSYRWRHIMRTPVGDALMARAHVKVKRVEADAHLVDLNVWIENLRGVMTECARATVKLPSRSD
jgi:hypothetical protein